MSVITPAELRARNLRTLAALAGLFLLPLAIAFFIYYGTGWRPSTHVNHGRLISPARPLTTVALPRIGLESPPAADPAEVRAAPFLKRWSLVYVGSGDCAAACRQALAQGSNSAPAHYYLGMNLGQLARTRGLSALKLVIPVAKRPG